MQKYNQTFNILNTPQNEAIPGEDQVKNNAGGYVYKVNNWDRLNRFLILGSDSNTYYVSRKELTKENASTIISCIKEDGQKVVNAILDVSLAGRAPSNDPALFALALCTVYGDIETKKYAFSVLPKVARISTHLFHFVAYRKGMAGWGRSMRTAIANWYTSKNAGNLAYQVVKYQQRDGWSHKDLLRLAHPKSKELNNIFSYIVGKDYLSPEKPGIIEGFEAAKTSDKRTLVKLIQDYNLTREMIPTKYLNDPEIQEALLQKMPITAMIRNLGSMSASGLLRPFSDITKLVVDRITDPYILKNGKVHPISILLALKTYASGHGFRGSLNWKTISSILNALNEAFYLTFDNVEPTNKRIFIGLDISSSMNQTILNTNLSVAEAAMAMSLITARTEKNYEIKGFASGERIYNNYSYNNREQKLVDINILPSDSLYNACNRIKEFTFGATDCALPIYYALDNKVPIDAFIIYTDNETWYGKRGHPSQALKEYRNKMGIDAKLVVCAMTSTEFSIADPQDNGMLDICGFDSSVPNIISEFIK